jgi:5-formyltetrahydrofolate cyclo-ligase
MSSALRAGKQALREAVTAARERIDPAIHAWASHAIATRITALESYRRAHVVLLTLPYRSEWDATLLVRHAIEAGKTVAAPRVDSSARNLAPLRILDLAHDIESGYRGIPEPRGNCAAVPLATIDWVLVPGVAFDTSGRRLGYGGGYYDRLLPRLSMLPPRIAAAFELQLVDIVPTAPHDIAVDCVVTEERTIDCAHLRTA